MVECESKERFLHMISQDALFEALGIDKGVKTDTCSMATDLNITFYPDSYSASKIVKDFSQDLEDVAKEAGVNIIPYNESIESISYLKVLSRFFRLSINNLFCILAIIPVFEKTRFWISWSGFKTALRRKRIKRGISVIVLGEQESSKLPMQYIYSFKHNSIVTIIDFPNGVNENSNFEENFRLSLRLFAYHMSNIIIGVKKKKWILYNLNGSYSLYENTKDKLLSQVSESLIPKLAAPIRPHTLDEFQFEVNSFNVTDEKHKRFVQDLVDGGKLFDKTNLFPQGVKIGHLPFRNNFHKWIGSIHLDGRSGMSYGFLARQLPIKITQISSWESLVKKKGAISSDRNYFWKNEKLYVKLCIQGVQYGLQIPDVWVLSQRSGSSKTNMNPKKDLIKLGLRSGKMYMSLPVGHKEVSDCKPSFDTKIILAHALGNAIAASVFQYFSENNDYVNRIQSEGIAICHWHGYFNKDQVPPNVLVYGENRPHVSCSSPQSAVYALEGKFEGVSDSLEFGNVFSGDIHIEPHHGININYKDVVSIAEYLLNNPSASVLGNEYLDLIKK